MTGPTNSDLGRPVITGWPDSNWDDLPAASGRATKAATPRLARGHQGNMPVTPGCRLFDPVGKGV